MIFRENTEYLQCTVKAGGRELYKDFDVTEAWNTMLEATNTQDSVTFIVKRMNSNQARSVSYGRKERGETCEDKNTTAAARHTHRYPKRP